MNTEVLGVIAQIVLMVVLSYPLGKYIAKVYKGEKTWSDFMKPVERVMFKPVSYTHLTLPTNSLV